MTSLYSVANPNFQPVSSTMDDVSIKLSQLRSMLTLLTETELDNLQANTLADYFASMLHMFDTLESYVLQLGKVSKRIS